MKAYKEPALLPRRPEQPEQMNLGPHQVKPRTVWQSCQGDTSLNLAKTFVQASQLQWPPA